jgi:orotate phosphoribosyltransferase
VTTPDAEVAELADPEQAMAVAGALVASGVFTADLRAPRERWIRWKSGVLAPCGCDCRRLTAVPHARRLVAEALATTVREVWPEADHLVGVAVAGVPWAMAVAERLDLPLAYVRAQARQAGGGLVEGMPGTAGHAVVIEDVIASGRTVRRAIDALRHERHAEVAGVVSIANWNFADMRRNLAGWPVRALCGHPHILACAETAGLLSVDDHARLLEFYRSPHTYSWPGDSG